LRKRRLDVILDRSCVAKEGTKAEQEDKSLI